MKHRMTLSIALTLSIMLVALATSDSTVKAQNQMRVVADTGDITLGDNQSLRVSVVSVDGELGGGLYGVRFRQMSYAQDACGSGVCKHAAASQTTSPTITVAPNEGVWIEIDRSANSTGTRAIVLSSRRNVKVTAIVFDTSTQRIVSFVNTTFDDEAAR